MPRSVPGLGWGLFFAYAGNKDISTLQVRTVRVDRTAVAQGGPVRKGIGNPVAHHPHSHAE